MNVVPYMTKRIIKSKHVDMIKVLITSRINSLDLLSDENARKQIGRSLPFEEPKDRQIELCSTGHRPTGKMPAERVKRLI